MPTPKKGPRFGARPAHQRLIMANLASSLFEAGYDRHHRAAAKALRPYAENLITKAKKGGVHQRRQVDRAIHDQDVTHKLFAEIGPRYRDRNGRLPADPEARPASRRQRAHGAHRTGVTQLPLSGAGDEHVGDRVLKLVGRVRRHRLPRVRRATRAAHRRRRVARSARTDRCGATTSRSPAPDAPTPACTRGARWCRADRRRSTSMSAGSRTRSRVSSVPRSWCATPTVVDGPFDARR